MIVIALLTLGQREWLWRFGSVREGIDGCAVKITRRMRWFNTMMHRGGVAGDAQLAGEVTPLDPRSVGKVVRYGTKSGVYTAESSLGRSLVYSQIYNYHGLLNYTSGIIHHVRLTGN